MDGTPAARVKERISVLEDQRAELKELIESTEEAPVLFHPNMAKRYHQEVRRLIASLNQEEHRAKAAGLLRSLIDRIVLTPTEARDRLTVDLVGDLAGILSIATNRKKPQIIKGLQCLNTGRQEAMVAGRRNQHNLLSSRSLQEAVVAGDVNLREQPGLFQAAA